MKIWRAVEFLTNAFAYVAGVMILLAGLFVSYSVTVRYMHFNPPIWVLQFTEYALLWITFMGAPWLLRSEGHVRIDTFVVLMGGRLRRAAEVLVSLLGAVVCLIIVWFGAANTIDLYQRRIMDVKGITVPEYPLFVIIPVGAALLLLQFGARAFRHFRSRGGDGEGDPV